MLIWPAVTIAPEVAPVNSSRVSPAMKRSMFIWPVEATSPPTSTREDAENSTPFGFRMTTAPLAVRAPLIWLGMPPPDTRLTAMELLSGW